MASELTAPPVLSTSAEHLFEHVPQPADVADSEQQLSQRSDDDLREIYEVARTVREVLDTAATSTAQDKKRRPTVALQFPDSMLRDAPRVVRLLQDEFAALGRRPVEETMLPNQKEETSENAPTAETLETERIYILADTSYSSCCVDEIAAEHADADIVVHYGRACLSPTSRLPVVYVFTKHTLDHSAVVADFETAFPDKGAKVVLMADVTYQDHVPVVYAELRHRGYSELLFTAVVHNPLGTIPNRTVRDGDGKAVDTTESSGVELKEFSIFHVSTPPTSLLLALSSRIQSLHIFPTPDPTCPTSSSTETDVSARRTRAILGRRYARVLTLATAGIIGILVNTLSVANYLSSIDSIRKLIAAAGKKSYTVVVGKLNPAKLANFAEVDGWVVVGCWESSLVEDDAGFYRPVVTPFELEVALMSDDVRVWGVSWWGGIEGVTEPEENEGGQGSSEGGGGDLGASQENGEDGGIEDEESVPPEFDLRTGKLVTRSRPMWMVAKGKAQSSPNPIGQVPMQSDILALRPKSEVAAVKGVASPGAEFLRSQRTWQGLGSDFDSEERSAAIEEGRSGVARGYTVGEDAKRT